MAFEVAQAAVGTALLAWAAVEDARTRTIPRLAGLGMLLLGLIALAQWKSGMGIERAAYAVYFLTAIWSTRGGAWRYVLVAASTVMLYLFGENGAPLVVGVLFVCALFWMKWFGGGDAQLAMGLVGIGHDWLVLALLFGLTIAVGMALTIARQGGVVKAGARMLWVARHMHEPPDEQAIHTPWAVVAAVAGVAYLWTQAWMA